MIDTNKLLSAMSSIEPYEPKDDDSLFPFINISTGNTIPPAYIVAFVFFSPLGFKNYGGFEKIWWHTYFKYKDCPFLIRDFKFGSWSLESRGDIEAAKSLVPEIAGKIRNASRYADRLLQLEFKKKIDQGQFYINNGYGKLSRAYKFYVSEVQSALDKLLKFQAKPASEKPDLKDFARRHNKRLLLENVLTYRCYPMMMSFFSLLEFILDVFYAFEQPDLSFFDFRRLTWRERLKKVVSLKPSTDMTHLYERLVNIWTQYRHPLTHGLTNESSFLFPFPFAGLVPDSYEHLSKTVHYGSVQIPQDFAREMMEAFAAFLGLIAHQEPYSYYVLYSEYGFSIPVTKQAVSAIRNEMKDYDSFEESLQAKSEYQDMIENRDI
jgi:hypothetical protein